MNLLLHDVLHLALVAFVVAAAFALGYLKGFKAGYGRDLLRVDVEARARR